MLLHKEILPSDKEFLKKYIVKNIIAHSTFLLGAFILIVIWFNLGAPKRIEIIGVCSGLILPILFTASRLFRISNEFKTGLKIQETTTIIDKSSSQDLTLENSMKLYSDEIKRSGLNKYKFNIGDRIMIHYLPNTKFIIKAEVPAG